MICPRCGNNLPDYSVACNKCGCSFSNNQPNQIPNPNTQQLNNNNNMVRQPQQMQVNNPNWYKPAPKKEDTRWITWMLVGFGVFIAFVLFITVALSVMFGNKNQNDKPKTTTHSSTTSSTTEATTEAVTEATTEPILESAMQVASDQSNMKIGEIGCNDELYVGLSHVKISDTFTTKLGSNEEIAPDKQVLFAYFDIFNYNEEKKHIDDNDFSCYVDGTNYSGVDTYFYYEEDGISNQYSTELYYTTCKLAIADFEIPREWSEIKLYYGSDCIWSLSPEDVSNEPFEFESMYYINYIKDSTQEGSTIYSDKYELIYDGHEYYTGDYSDDKYIIFKFTVNNTGSSELDYGLVGYSMECYADNYITYGSDYTIHDKIGDYINIYDLDKIQSGMSAKIFVAFEINGEHDFYRMVYDAGYIADDYLADIYVNENDSQQHSESDATSEE